MFPSQVERQRESPVKPRPERVARKSSARFAALLGVVDPATTCVALRAILSISRQRGSWATCSGLPKNPPGSSHAPGSQAGCTLFVKLWHLDPEDDRRIVVDTKQASWYPGLVTGLSVMPLFEFGISHTALVRWDPGTHFNPHRHYGGEEIYVQEGMFEDEHGQYPAGTWIRSPHMSAHHPFSTQGCIILVKTGHLYP